MAFWEDFRRLCIFRGHSFVTQKNCRLVFLIHTDGVYESLVPKAWNHDNCEPRSINIKPTYPNSLEYVTTTNHRRKPSGGRCETPVSIEICNGSQEARIRFSGNELSVIKSELENE